MLCAACNQPLPEESTQKPRNVEIHGVFEPQPPTYHGMFVMDKSFRSDFVRICCWCNVRLGYMISADHVKCKIARAALRDDKTMAMNDHEFSLKNQENLRFQYEIIEYEKEQERKKSRMGWTYVSTSPRTYNWAARTAVDRPQRAAAAGADQPVFREGERVAIDVDAQAMPLRWPQWVQEEVAPYRRAAIIQNLIELAREREEDMLGVRREEDRADDAPVG